MAGLFESLLKIGGEIAKKPLVQAGAFLGLTTVIVAAQVKSLKDDDDVEDVDYEDEEEEFDEF